MNAKTILTEIKKSSPILFFIGLLCFLLAIFCFVGLFIDERQLFDVSIWLKPLKFSISTGIYILTVGYLITLYPFSTGKRNIINNIVSWTLLIELIIIITQAYRGQMSHYNQSSSLDGLLFAMMGILIAVNVLIMILFIIEAIRLKLKTPKSIQWAILIGWVVVLIGSWVGGQMIGQLAHNVGTADGGPGLPFLNWSTIAGDLRVAHFFGLHGIQIIPLFSYLCLRWWNINYKSQIALTTVFSFVYISWLGYTFYQAKLGIALIQQLG